VVGLDGAEVFAHLAHPTRGYKLGIPVTLGLPDEIVELVFEEPVTTELVLVRATGPLVEGGGGRVFDRRFTRSISGPVSDDQGRSIWTNLAPGEYAFVFDDPGYWAIQQPITIAAGAAPTTVTLYRLCNLDVEVTRAGVPASDVHVRLKRTDGNTPLARFIEWGQIHSSTGGVTTGGDGRFRLEGVAEGNYEWSIDAPEGPVQAHGVVQVRPEQDCVLRVEL
jgi:hypothetical protein